MRYTDGISVFIPWLDSNNDRNHTRFTFNGDVDRRRVRRELRKAMRPIGRTPKWWLDHYIKTRAYVPGGGSPA